MKYIAFALAVSIALCASRADSQTFTTLVQFTGSGGTASGVDPNGGLTLSGTTLYGMTEAGGANSHGNVFSVGVNGKNFVNLLSFTGTNSGPLSGETPNGDLALVGNTLFGMTNGMNNSTANGYGNLFSVGTDGSNYQNLVSFTGGSGTAAGEDPQGRFTLGGTTLYGPVSNGGSQNNGLLFSNSTAGTNYQKLVGFTGQGGATPGILPAGTLALSGTTLYGMTVAGGANTAGNIYAVQTDGTNFRTLLTFSPSGTANGNASGGGLTLSGTTLYGMAQTGGANGDGYIFSISIYGTNFRNLLSFTGTSGAAIGQNPQNVLILSGTTLYGVTEKGGYGAGNIFSVGIDGSGFDDLHNFTGGVDGATPGDLTLSGGTLFGMTLSGGRGVGVIFALTLPTPEPGTLALVGAMLLGGFMWRRRWRRLAIIASVALLPSSIASADVFNMPSGETSLQFVTVGDPGNVADSTGYGAVPYTFNMGKYDVTLGQYVQFLNAVAKTDTYGCYNSVMSGGFANNIPFGIAQFSGLGGYSYSVTGANFQAANMPVYGESWDDAVRFCNWLENGQPSGAEGNGTTETGANNLSGATSQAALMAVATPAHNGSGSAHYFLPSEDEWHKAAYYETGGTNAGYWTYPAQSSTVPDHSLAFATSESNDANYAYADPKNNLTPVGAFVLSPGPYGTFDQGGDVYQWNEANISNMYRGLRGGAFYFLHSDALSSSSRDWSDPTSQRDNIGFRVASSATNGHAINGQWAVNSGGRWSASGNWTGGVPGGSTKDTAVFGPVLTSGTADVTVDGNRGLSSLGLSPAGGASYLISASGGSTLTLANVVTGSAAISNGGGNNTIDAPIILASNLNVTATAGSVLTIAEGVSESGGSYSVSFSGGGELILSGGDTYTGGTSVLAGTMIVDSSNSLLSGTSLNVGTAAQSVFGRAVSAVSAAESGGAAVPEPSTLAQLGAAGFALLWRARRRSGQHLPGRRLARSTRCSREPAASRPQSPRR
jgi:autotransporter-associated beta strand protein/uncharacterized repeat protein (TIGR03803 family)